MNFGERLIFAREKKGLTQKKLSELLEITPTRLNYWEKNKREPNVEMIFKISQILDISSDFLIGLESLENINQVKNKNELPQNKKELLDNYDKLNEDGKEEANKRVEELTHMDKYTNTEQKDECPIDHDIARKYFLHIDKKTNQPVFSIPFWDVLEEIRKNSDTVTEQLIAYGGSGNFLREISREEAEIKKKAIEEALNNKKDNEL